MSTTKCKPSMVQSDVVEGPRGVESLRSRFEALAKEGGQEAARRAHIQLPRNGTTRPRTLSSPATPASPRPGYFDDAQLLQTSPESARQLRASPSQPELTTPVAARAGGSRSAETSNAGTPPVTPAGDLQRTTSPAISLTKPPPPPRPLPNPPSVTSPRKAPAPPIPRRPPKSSATAPAELDGVAEQTVMLSHSPTTVNGHSPIKRRPSPTPAPLLSPPRARSSDMLALSPAAALEPYRAGPRSTSPLPPTQAIDVPGAKLPPPLIPPRPTLSSSPAVEPGTSAPPALPPRRPTLPSPQQSRAPHQALLHPTTTSAPLRRASEADTRILAAPTPRTAAMAISASDNGVRPPPPRSIGLNERLAPVRPSSSGSGAVSAAHTESSDEEDEAPSPGKGSIDDLPDATYASRRAPELVPPRALYSKTTVNCVAVRGSTVVVGGLHHLRVYDCTTGEQTMGIVLAGEPKITALGFRSTCRKGDGTSLEDKRYVWVGCKDGQLFEVDIYERHTIDARSSAHSHAVLGVFRVGESMVTLDESGKLQVWPGLEGRAPDLSDTVPRTSRIDKAPLAVMLNDQLWAASYLPRTGGVAGSSRQAVIRAYSPLAIDSPSALMARPLAPPDTAGPVGAASCASTLQSLPGHVFIGHESGHVSSWSSETFTCLDVFRISNYHVTALCGVGTMLWAGFRTGTIYVYDVQPRPWKVVKAWKAHKDAVSTIFVDESSLWTDASLHVISVGIDQQIHIWDGFLRTDWFAMQLSKRDADFCSYRPLRILMTTWNVDAAKPTELANDIVGSEYLSECLASVESPDVIVFGFQELVDLEDKRLTAKSLLLGRKKNDAKLSEVVTGQYRHWHDKLVQAVRLAMPADCPYSLVHVENLVGLFTCVFVRHTERSRLRDIAVTSIKTGMGGRYGNKGAIVARFVIDDSSLCFVNCHLAAGQSHKRQRNADLIQILEAKSPFADLPASPSSAEAWVGGGDGTMVFDHSLLFLSGDLNYRIDLGKEVVVRQVGEGDLAPLLEADQLMKEMRTNNAFRLRSFVEPKINFAPTYKYDRHSTSYDTSEKARAPAWCDRILYRAPDNDAVCVLHYRRHEVRVSDHRPVSAGFVARVRSVDHHKRAIVEQQVAVRWSEHESALLHKAKAWYGKEGR